MKQFIIVLTLLGLCHTGLLQAANTDISSIENVIYVTPLLAPANSQVSLPIQMKNTAAIRGFQFDLYLPEGVTVVRNDKGRIQGALTASRLPEDDEHTLTLSEQEDGAIRFLCGSQYDECFTGNDGEIATLSIQISGSVAIGDYPIILRTVKLTETDISKFYETEELESTITVTAPADGRVVLDENSTTAPAPAENVDVRVKRTINANEWSTICLPFDMTTEQLNDAFGEMGTGWMLADFQGVEPETEPGENVVGISINFGKATAIEANHPYLIKVSEAVSSFTVDGVEIDPDDEPSVDKDEYRTGAGTKKDPYVYHYNRFVGSYVKDTEIPELCLFLNGNKFYYSSGATKMKAFRGYFDFYDVLSEVENANSRVRLVWDGQATTIAEIDAPNVLKGAVYNLNGQFMGTDVDLKSLPKGIYMVDGKKVVNY